MDGWVEEEVGAGEEVQREIEGAGQQKDGRCRRCCNLDRLLPQARKEEGRSKLASLVRCQIPLSKVQLVLPIQLLSYV